jgi:hypothetical protein
MTSDVAVPIADGEIVPFVLAIEKEMERWVKHDGAQLDMTRRAVELVKNKYTRERERADVVRVFGEALERVMKLDPGSVGLNVGLLPSTNVEMQRMVNKNVES